MYNVYKKLDKVCFVSFYFSQIISCSQEMLYGNKCITSEKDWRRFDFFFKYSPNTNEKFNITVCNINFTRCEKSLLLRQARNIVPFHKHAFLAE